MLPRLRNKEVLDVAGKAAELLLKIKTAGEESLDKVKESFISIGKAGLIAFGALTAIVAKSIAEYKGAEEASNALTRSMVNSGIYSKQLKADYDEQAKSLQKITNYEDDNITAAQASLQMQLREIPVSKDLMKAVMDLATAKKMDLVSAAELVGKTIGTSTNALMRQGITVSDTTDKHKRLAEVVAGVNSHMGGQAEAAANGLGILERLHITVGNLFEALGERLAPAITLVAGWLNTLSQDTTKTTGVMDAFVAVIHFISNLGIRAAAVIDALGISIGGGLATAFEAVSAAAQGNFSQAFEITKTGMTAIVNETIARKKLMNDQLQALNVAFEEQTIASQVVEEENLRASLVRKSEIVAIAANEAAVLKLEKDIEQQQFAMSMIDANEGAQIASIIAWNDKKLAAATTAAEKKKLLQQKYALIERAEEIKMQEFKKKTDEQTVQNRADTLAKISTLQSSSNHALAVIGKAAAITQIAIETPVAIAKALAAFPPPYNFAAAGLVGVAMAAQAANIAGVQLAEGGIVKARPGGIQATIGEGGQDEAVIPLDRAGEFMGGGGNITIIVNGGLLGSDSEAHEFAKAVDRELLKLRQNNESVAFDSRVS